MLIVVWMLFGCVMLLCFSLHLGIFVGCLPGFTGVFGEGSKPLPGGVREGNSEDL